MELKKFGDFWKEEDGHGNGGSDPDHCGTGRFGHYF